MKNFLISLLVSVALVTIKVWNPFPVQVLELKSIDLTLRSKEVTPNNDIVIIDVSDKTLEKLGQWPIDRKEFADMITRLRQYQAGAIVFPILFSEPDRSGHDKEFADAIKLDVSPRISAVAFIPANNVPTSKARKMLPESIPHKDAVQNSINTALLTQALTHRPDLLLPATEDFLHQSYREAAMPKSYALMQKLRAAGVAAFISGAGPTVLALLVDADLNHELGDLVRAAGTGFEVENLDISSVGYQVSNI